MARRGTNRSTRISIEVFGEKEISREMLRRGERVTHAEPAWVKISRLLTARTKLHWKSDGSRAGTPWKPLADSTIARKRRMGMDRGILRLRRVLERSLTRVKAAGAIREIKPLELKWGSSVDHGKYHHSRRPRTSNLPRRPVVGFVERDKRDVMKILQRWVMTGSV